MSALPAALEADEALDLIGGGLATDAVGPLAGVPIVTVRATPGAALDRFMEIARTLPCVVAAVGDPHGSPPIADVLVTGDTDPGAPWVGGVDDSALQQLTAAVQASPEAAVTLVQVLRASERLDAPAALVVESLAYGLLQAGPHHQAWLAKRRASTEPRLGVDPVLVEREESVVTLTLNRPDVRNAYNADMRDALAEALAWVAADPSIVEVHLRGAGRAFSSGGDLDEFGAVGDSVTAHLIRSTRSPAALLHVLADRVTVHVHGACVGAGVEFAAFAHRVVSAEDATFRLPEVSMGVLPGAGGTVSIPRRIGRSRTAWLALTGATIGAETALEWGLVDAAQ